MSPYISIYLPYFSLYLQALVRAFELLTAPEPPPEASASARAKAKSAISRSNERCFKTEIHCPRCKAPWGTADSGVQPFDYNFMMQVRVRVRVS